MAIKWRLVGNHTLAGWWHLMFVPLYLGAVLFHGLSAVQHWRDAKHRPHEGRD